MDNSLTTSAYPAYTVAELRAAVAAGNGTDKMIAEIARRDAIAAGDLSQMTPIERLAASRRR